MRQVVGKKSKEISKNEFLSKIENYKKRVLDFGCGDGRFCYKNAIKNPHTFFVGIDPNEKQLEKFSNKSMREKIDNCLFLIASDQTIPDEIFFEFDKIIINFPWGTLLANIAAPNQIFYENLKNLLRNKKGEIQIIFGHNPEFEPNHSKRLELPEITKSYIEDTILPELRRLGFEISEFRLLYKDQINELETTWARKLRFGMERDYFYLKLMIE